MSSAPPSLSPRHDTAGAVLELQGIDLSFGGIHALHGIDLRMRPGERLP